MPCTSGIYSRLQDWFNNQKSIIVIYHMSICTGKSFHKIQHSFMIKKNL